MKLHIFVTYVILLCITVGLLWYVAPTAQAPTIDTIWVINLDKEPERLQNILNKTHSMGGAIQRWPATYGKEERVDTAMADGVGLILCTQHYEPNAQKTELVNRNEGAVGCWLSHTRLLKHLASKHVPETWGHLIVEDDLEFPPDFIEQWERRRHAVPSDWDIVYLGIHRPKGHFIRDGLLRAEATNDTGNWGTHAYIVRHGSLKNRILPRLQYMSHDIDVQLNLQFNELNVYIMEPAIVKVNSTLAAASSITV